MSLDSVGHNLLHALQWEQHDLEVSDPKERWNLSEEESNAVKKWVDARIAELKNIRDN